MKTILLPALSNLGRAPHKHFLTLLLIVGAWSGATTAHAQLADAVGAWGFNGDGQTTVPLAAQSGVTAIAAGYAHTVALKNDGAVLAWGYGYGATAVLVAVQSGVTAIAAGGFHTVALKTNGSVVAWGNDDYGQTTVPLAAQSGVVAIAAGGHHTMALKNDGSVVAWGYNYFGQTTVPVTAQSGVMTIAAGDVHTVALKNDGSVVAWGQVDNGHSFVPVSVPAGLSGVTAIAAGRSHTVALKSDGSVVVWGYNAYGQTNVPVAAQSGVTAIAAGGSHTVALKNDGSVLAWGKNDEGQTNVPAGLTGVTAIAAGGGHTVVLVLPTAPIIITQPVSQLVNEWRSASFSVTATGFPLSYQWRQDGVDLAGATSATYSLPFARAHQAGNYTVVVNNGAGSVTSAPPAVLTVNSVSPGAVVAWGDNYYDQTSVPIAAQSRVTAIAAGFVHTVALKNDGSVLAWGAGTSNTGNPNFGQSLVPIAALSGVTAIAAGNYHTVALKNDGAVVAWGANSSGQVTGTPTTADPYPAIASPITLGGHVLSGVTAIAAGGGHTVALKNDGSVVAWGNNYYGQVTGTPINSEPYSATASPVTVGGQVLSGVTAIAAGRGHTVALKDDGTVVAWGNNGDGQVTGTPTTTDPDSSAIANPVTLGGQVLSGVTAIAAEGAFTFAWKSNGTVVVWGSLDQTTAPLAAQSGVRAIAAGGLETVALKSDGTVVSWPDLNQTPALEGLGGFTAIAAGVRHFVALIGTGLLLPAVNVRPSGNALILSWPSNGVGFTLQSTPNLIPPATWIDSTTSPALVGAQFTVTNTPSGSTQFYRLSKP